MRDRSSVHLECVLFKNTQDPEELFLVELVELVCRRSVSTMSHDCFAERVMRGRE